jgi:hypothetical protein
VGSDGAGHTQVFITNPNHLPHILRFLRSGAIMNRTFQPFEVRHARAFVRARTLG